MDSQVEEVKENLEFIQNLCLKVINNISTFEVACEAALPYGLKPHTRSVSWLVEQVLVQRFKHDAEKMKIGKVDYDLPDTALHDLIIHVGDKNLPINIKTHQVQKKQNKNDISAVEKLYKAYVNDPAYNLYYAAFGIEFVGRNIQFVRDSVHCFSPQFMPIYVNPRNDKIQAYYQHEVTMRSRKQFLAELSAASTSIKL
jgi:hypothetical protein